MVKRETPKKVTLLNGRTFVARYEQVTRNHLPANIRLRRPYKQRAAPRGRHRRQIAVQKSRGLGSNILKFAKKLLQSDFANTLVDMGTVYERQKLG